MFCERIFGPTERLGMLIAENIKESVIKALSATAAESKSLAPKVRRERMGHIELAAPVLAYLVF